MRKTCAEVLETMGTNWALHTFCAHVWTRIVSSLGTKQVKTHGFLASYPLRIHTQIAANIPCYQQSYTHLPQSLQLRQQYY